MMEKNVEAFQSSLDVSLGASGEPLNKVVISPFSFNRP